MGKASIIQDKMLDARNTWRKRGVYSGSFFRGAEWDGLGLAYLIEIVAKRVGWLIDPDAGWLDGKAFLSLLRKVVPFRALDWLV
jgi:hypothetical protein